MCLFAKINIEGAILSQRGGPTLDSFAQSGPVSLKWIFIVNTTIFFGKKTRDFFKSIFWIFLTFLKILNILNFLENYQKFRKMKISKEI